MRLSSNVAAPEANKPMPSPRFEAVTGIVIVHVPGGSTPALDPHVTRDPPVGRRVWFGATPCTIHACRSTPCKLFAGFWITAVAVDAGPSIRTAVDAMVTVMLGAATRLTSRV